MENKTPRQETVISRQNAPTALKYHKASLYCYKRERTLKYAVIFVSMLLCLSGVIANYLPELFVKMGSDRAGVEVFKNNILIVISYASGFVVVLQLLFNKIAKKMHIEGANIQEKYDLYVYNMQPNETIMRAVDEPLIDNYSYKIKKPDMDFYDQYWDKDGDPNEKNLIFNNQKRIFYDEYQLMIFIKQAYFNILWIGFFLAILVFAVINATQTFQSVLMGIFFPSLSAISLIVGSWLNYNEQFIYLRNGLNWLDKYEAERKDLSNPAFLRNIQDSIFFNRYSSFLIPFFMIKEYEKHAVKNEAVLAEINNKKLQKLEYQKQILEEEAKREEQKKLAAAEPKHKKISITDTAAVRPKSINFKTNQLVSKETKMTTIDSLRAEKADNKTVKTDRPDAKAVKQGLLKTDSKAMKQDLIKTDSKAMKQDLIKTDSKAMKQDLIKTDSKAVKK